MMTTPAVLTYVGGGIGRIVLNRPQSLNALNHEMVSIIRSCLYVWKDDPYIEAVLITGRGQRGLCAGGDMVAIYQCLPHDLTRARAFFRDEYTLNYQIHDFPKPYIALMDGIVMGGGLGISAHGSVRLVTETTAVAMPEVAIGFIPDVGGTSLLAHAPGLTGLHLGLTGTTVNGADAIYLGWADHYLAHEDCDQFVTTVMTHGIEIALQRYCRQPPASSLAQAQSWIDHCYDHESLIEILHALQQHPHEDARHAGQMIQTRSPVALMVTLEAIRQAYECKTFAQVLTYEFAHSCAALRSVDLVEGIRAQLIEKDRHPHWCPSQLAQIDPKMVASYFCPVDNPPCFD